MTEVGGEGKRVEGKPPVSTPLPRGERHDINEHEHFREEETKHRSLFGFNNTD